MTRCRTERRRGWMRMCLSASAALGLMVAVRADWPEYLGGPERRGIDPAGVAVAAPALLWRWQAAHPPRPGFYHALMPETMGPQRILARPLASDCAFAPVVADGRAYFGSSSEDSLTCLDAATGERQWRFFAEGALRLAPTVAGGAVIFGSDDGRVYALDAVTGRERWRFVAAPEERRIPANGRIGSQWPVRTAVSVRDGIAYFAAGLFPANGGVYLFAVQVSDGTLLWKRQIQLPAQGYILVGDEILYVPNGRASPAEYRRADGSPLVDRSDLRRQGGGGRIWMAGDMLVYGPTEFGILQVRTSREEMPGRDYNRSLDRAIHGQVTGISGEALVAHGDLLLWLRGKELVAVPAADAYAILARSGAEIVARMAKRIATEKSGVQLSGDRQAEQELVAAQRWQAAVPDGRSLIVAGDMAVVGAEGRVLAFDLATGAPRLDVPVPGVVYELAAAGGRIFAATDRGCLHAFGDPRGQGSPRELRAAVAPAPVPDAVAAYVREALALLPNPRGYCFVVGLDDGAVLRALAATSEMEVVGVTADAGLATRLRNALAANGEYGGRIRIEVVAGEALPYASHLANLILTEGGDPGVPAAELQRLLRPWGGILAVPQAASATFAGVPGLQSRGALAVAIRGALPGAGQWTHMFADPANTSCSGDTLVGGLGYRVQWFGEPSPPRRVGWHGNGMGPLFADGILYQLKVDHVEAVDAYNGTSLWARETPGSARFSPGREGGSGCVADGRLHLLADGQCQVFDGHSGKLLQTLAGPPQDATLAWGYIAVADDMLVGSKQDVRATYNRLNRSGLDLVKGQWESAEPLHALSLSLFAHRRSDGAVAWRRGDGQRAILNSSIAIADGTVYFLESRSAAAAEARDGSLSLRDFLAGGAVHLVALDLATGAVRWERPFTSKATTMLYLSVDRGELILASGHHVGPLADFPAGNKSVPNIAKELGLPNAEAMQQIRDTKIAFAFACLDAADGREKWASEYVSANIIGAQHNYNVSHPVIVADTIWHAPAEQYIVRVDRQDGTITELKRLKRSKGCATPTASARAMFFRSLVIASLDFASEKMHYLSQVSRPSCWMSILPAGGLVMMPEYSIGCNCAFPLQTSIVMAPVADALPTSGPALGPPSAREAAPSPAAATAAGNGSAPAGQAAAVAKEDTGPRPGDAVEFRGRWYKVFKDKVSREEASSRCAAMGGVLVRVDNEEELRFLVDTLKAKGVWARATLDPAATMIGGGGRLNSIKPSGITRAFVCEWSR